jgi:serine/threonine protein kinase
MGLHKGNVINGYHDSYTIQSLIGCGGLGCVWKANAADGTIVAIKEPLTGTPQDQMNLEKLQIEADVLEKLTGSGESVISTDPPTKRPLYNLDSSVRSHIVQFKDFGKSPPRKLVLQFVEGTSLDKKTRAGLLTPSEVDEYITVILQVVKALHENNILHRDISPHNLITTSVQEMDPVLIDFGTVKVGFQQLSASVLAESVIQKAGYSAPELTLGLASPSSDLYSVAATMLFLYTGENPVGAGMLKGGELDENNKLVRKMVPEERRQTIRKALSYIPSLRYQTADDMLAAIAGVQILTSKPHIVASGRKYILTGSMIIGRNHQCPLPDCRGKGFWHPPDILINDLQQYVSKHHAKVQLDSKGTCWIEDLSSMSQTAIRRSTGRNFEILKPSKGYKLEDGDIIALAYSPTKGPYMTISYHESDSKTV